jgi:hypothetical protein
MGKPGWRRTIGFAITDGKKPLHPGTPEYKRALEDAAKHLPADVMAIIQDRNKPMPKGPQGQKRKAD